MTYVPVKPEDRLGHGRKPLEIPAALIAQLRHARDTNSRCRLELTPDDDPADVDELRRAAIRAGYHHFPDHRVVWEPDDQGVTYYLKKKQPRTAKKPRARTNGA
jgi:hypothetical protein